MQIKVDGVPKQVFLAEMVKATPPVSREVKKPQASYLSPIAPSIVRTNLKKAGVERISGKSSISQSKEKGKQAQILQLALTSCSMQFLESDRVLTCQTSCYVPATEVTAIDTKSQTLWLRSGISVPAKITTRRLTDSERIFVGQKQLAANQAEAKEKAEAEAAFLNTKIDRLLHTSGELADAHNRENENPLISMQGIINYLLTANALIIKGDVAFALLRVAYGITQAQAAKEAKVSLKTLQRALRKMEKAQYSKLFERSKIQKREAFTALNKPHEQWAAARKMAKEDPEKLRYITEQMIIREDSNNAEQNLQDDQFEIEDDN